MATVGARPHITAWRTERGGVRMLKVILRKNHLLMKHHLMRVPMRPLKEMIKMLLKNVTHQNHQRVRKIQIINHQCKKQRKLKMLRPLPRRRVLKVTSKLN